MTLVGSILLIVVLCGMAMSAEECDVSPANLSQVVTFSHREYEYTQPIGTVLNGSMTVLIERMEGLTDLRCTLLLVGFRGDLLLNGIEYKLDLNDSSFTAGFNGHAISVEKEFVLNNSDYEQCTHGNKTYYVFPLNLMVQPPQTIGERVWEFAIALNNDGETLSNRAVVSVTTKPNTTCQSNDQLFIFSSKNCVDECPCYMKSFPHFCFRITNQIDFNIGIKEIVLPANTSSGVIYKVPVLVHESLISNGSIREIVGLVNMGSLPFRYTQNQYPKYNLDFPEEYMLDSRTEVIVDIVPNRFEDMRSVVNNCTSSEGRNYIQLFVDIILISSSPFHLGAQQLNLFGSEFLEIEGILHLTVENEPCPSKKSLFDFATQECVAVNNCSCGYVPNLIDQPYCEPVGYGISRPTNFGESSLNFSVAVNSTVSRIVRVYVNSVYEGLFPPGSVSTSTISMELSLSADQIDESTSLQFSIANEDALNRSIPLDNSTFNKQKSCIAELLSLPQQNFLLLNVTITAGSAPGLFRYTLTANYSSTDPNVSDNLHNPMRAYPTVNQVLINSMALEINVVSPMSTNTIQFSTSTITMTMPPGPTVQSTVIVGAIVGGILAIGAIILIIVLIILCVYCLIQGSNNNSSSNYGSEMKDMPRDHLVNPNK